MNKHPNASELSRQEQRVCSHADTLFGKNRCEKLLWKSPSDAKVQPEQPSQMAGRPVPPITQITPREKRELTSNPQRPLGWH